MPSTKRVAASGGVGLPRALRVAILLSSLLTQAAAQCAPESYPLSLSLYGIDGVQCKQSSGTHSFTIDNPLSARLVFYSTDGADCSGTSLPYNYYASPYSNTSGTFSKLITVTNAPCRSSPCCALVYCVRCGAAFDAAMRALIILPPFPTPTPT